MNTNQTNNDPSNADGSGTAEARSALHHLAGRARTEPTRSLGTYEMVAESTDVDQRQPFEWRRLAVAASIVALVGGGVVVLNQRSGDAGIGAPVVDPIPTDSQQQGDSSGGAPSLGAGFGPAPSAFSGDARQYLQRQYAENIERPETGRFLTVTDVPDGLGQAYNYISGDFYLTFEPGRAGTAPPTTDPATTVTGETPATLSEAEAPPATVASPDLGGIDDGTVNESMVQCAYTLEAGEEREFPAATATISSVSSDNTDCHTVAVTEVDGSFVALVASGLSDAEFEAAMANIVPASDGLGFAVAPAALPAGLSEIATGWIATMFEPLPATEPVDRVELAWTPGSLDPNPVLDSAGVDQAKIRVITDGGTGLAGQRLLMAQVEDATVGTDPAVVQIAPSVAVRVVWRHEGTLYMYEEIGDGADADATVRRAGELLPFIGELAGGQYPTETTVPDGTVVYYCDDAVPTTVTLEWVDGSVPDTVDLSFPPVDCVTVPPTSVMVAPTTEPDQHSPTTGPEYPSPTTETTPIPPTYDTSPTATTAIPDWPVPPNPPTPTTEEPYPDPDPDPTDTLGTTTIPGYSGGNSATTTYPGQ